jgi:WD40 repeat protein
MRLCLTMRTMTGLMLALVLALAGGVGGASAQDKAPLLPPGEKQPILRLEGGGPTSYVTALAFSPDGRRLYAAGFDKVVRVWQLDGATWKLTDTSYRVPIGPGLNGAIVAMGLSDDGEWLAVAGQGMQRNTATFRTLGILLPGVTRSQEQLLDQGMIFVFHLKEGTVKVLRGHTGPVASLAFGPVSKPGVAPALASLAHEVGDDGKAVAGLRAWDVGKGQLLGVIRFPDFPVSVRPGVAVFVPKDGKLRVGVAAYPADGKARLRVWDVAAGKFGVDLPNDLNSHALFWLADRGLLLSAGLDPQNRGQMRVWAPDTATTPAPVRILGQNEWTRALHTVSAKGDGVVEHLARVVEMLPTDGATDRYTYKLVLATRSPAEDVRTVTLWTGNRNQPVLAATPKGQYLAVAGNDAQTIHLYKTADLLAGKDQPQILQSAWAGIVQAAFVKKGQALGLVLSTKAKAKPGDAPRAPDKGSLIFDFIQAQLLDQPAGWALATPALGPWSIKAVVPAPDKQKDAATVVVVEQAGQEKARITLADGNSGGLELVSDLALLPPGKGTDYPIAAVATRQAGLPKLMLYHGTTGQPISRLEGHTDPIRSIAWSDDGKFLVSVAEDQTINVYSMFNTLQTLDKFGMIRGLPLTEVNGKLAVGPIDAARYQAELDPANKQALADKAIKPGDRIEGIIEPGAKQPTSFATSYDFYLALSKIEPGKTVTLQVAGKGAVPLLVGQAVQVRNPLMTLFVTGDQGGVREWIGWSSSGPYEYSARKAERWIGWHFNTGKVDAPAGYSVPMEQYHKEFYRPGILKYLVQTGSVVPALKAWQADNVKPLPAPALQPFVDNVPLDPTEPAIVRQMPGKLTVQIGLLAPEEIAQAEYQLDDGPRQPLAPVLTAPDQREADLAKLQLKPGPHRLRLIVRTAEEVPQTTIANFNFRYQLSLPELTTAAPAQQVVPQAAFEWPISVKAAPGQPLKLRFSHRHDGKDQPAPEERVVEGGELKATFKLLPGENLLEAIAEYANTPEADRVYERSSLTIAVNHQPSPAPRIALTQLVPLDAQGKPMPPLLLAPGQTARVAVPTVQLVGSVQSAQPLDLLAWGILGGKRQELLKVGKQDYQLRQTLTLPPGQQTVRVLAKDSTGQEASSDVQVTFAPPVPLAVITDPVAGMTFYGPDEPTDTAIVATFGPPELLAKTEPFIAEVVVNGQVQGEPAQVAAGVKAMVFKVQMQPGANRVLVRTRSKWGAEASSEPVTLRYLSLPTITAGQTEPVAKQGLVKLTAEVDSTTPLTAQQVRVQVNAQSLIVPVQLAKQAGDRWSLALDPVPLQAGKNQIALSVENADGLSRQPAVWNIDYQPAKGAEPPQVRFVVPTEAARVVDAKLAVEVRITSAAKLQRVDLYRTVGADTQRFAVPPAQVQAVDATTYRATLELPLVNGINSLRAVAISDNGLGEAQATVARVQTPLDISLRAVVPLANQPLARNPTPADARRPPVLRQAPPRLARCGCAAQSVGSRSSTPNSRSRCRCGSRSTASCSRWPWPISCPTR